MSRKYRDVEAIVLSARNNGNHVLLTLLTKDGEILTAKAHGAKSHRSKLFAASQVMVHGMYTLSFVRAQEYDRVTLLSAEILRSHFRIREYPEHLGLSQYFLEMMCFVTKSRIADPELFGLLSDCLDALTLPAQSSNPSPFASRGMILRAVFLVKMSEALGIRPRLTLPEETASAYSGGEQAGGIIFSVTDGTVRLQESSALLEEGGVRINTKWIRMVSAFFAEPLSRLLPMKMNAGYIRSITEVFEKYIQFHFELPPLKSGNMI